MERHRIGFWIYWLMVVGATGLIGASVPAGAKLSAHDAKEPVKVTQPMITALPVDASALGEVELAGEPSGFDQVGVASWYGSQHQGRLTANGQRFDEHKLTAAHRSLPLDTRVRVTNLENGRHVDVTVNDRGPYIDGRVIDLSTRAARQLGMMKEGLALVRIEVLPEQTAAVD
jgi:rare lipoprotein A